MTRHFIEHIRIKNFKCFEDLQIKGLARVNLFGGKNNVGKTALLEAIELNSSAITPQSLALKLNRVLRRRQVTGIDSEELAFNLFKILSKSLEVSSNTNEFSIEFHVQNPSLSASQVGFFSDGTYLEGKSSNLLFILSTDDSKMKILLSNLFSSKIPAYISELSGAESDKSFFIKPSKLEENEIAVLYGGLVEADKESYLNESLNNFDNSLLSFKAIPTDRKARAKLKVAGRDSLVSLSEMGDGISRYIAILCAIWSAQNGFLFIDEIENGIHYTNYPKLWNLIFDASEQANCQVFATSHSKECIEAFNQVQQAREAFKDAGCYFELFKSMKTGRITAAARGSEQLQYALEHGEEIRGE